MPNRHRKKLRPASRQIIVEIYQRLYLETFPNHDANKPIPRAPELDSLLNGSEEINLESLREALEAGVESFLHAGGGAFIEALIAECKGELEMTKARESLKESAQKADELKEPTEQDLAVWEKQWFEDTKTNEKFNKAILLHVLLMVKIQKALPLRSHGEGPVLLAADFHREVEPAKINPEWVPLATETKDVLGSRPRILHAIDSARSRANDLNLRFDGSDDSEPSGGIMPEPTSGNVTIELTPGRERVGDNPNAVPKKTEIDDQFKTDLKTLVTAAAAVNVGSLITDYKTNKGIELARQQILPIIDNTWILIRKFKEEVAVTAFGYDDFRQECEDLLSGLRAFIAATDPTWWGKYGKWLSLLLSASLGGVMVFGFCVWFVQTFMYTEFIK